MSKAAVFELPERFGVGVYVSNDGERFGVFDGQDRLLHGGLSMLTALRFARFHAGTRFVYFYVNEQHQSPELEESDFCWDGRTEQFVSYDEFQTIIRESLNVNRKRS